MSVYVLGVSTTPPPVTPPRTDTEPPGVTWSAARLTSSRGTVSLVGDGVDMLAELRGLGPVARVANLATALGMPGKVPVRRRPVSDQERRISGPLIIRGATAAQRAEIQSEVLRILTPPDDSPVTFSLLRGDQLVSVEGFAEFSGDDFEAEVASDDVAVVGLTLVCPSSYWSGQVQQWTLRPNLPEPFFPILPAVVRTPTGLGLASEVTTDGDVPTWATITWRGPGTALEFATSRGTWRLDLEDPLTADDEVIVRTDPRAQHAGLLAVEGPGGESYWRYLTQRQFRPLTPGEETITITVDGQSASTEVIVSWQPQWRDVP